MLQGLHAAVLQGFQPPGSQSHGKARKQLQNHFGAGRVWPRFLINSLQVCEHEELLPAVHLQIEIEYVLGLA